MLVRLNLSPVRNSYVQPDSSSIDCVARLTVTYNTPAKTVTRATFASIQCSIEKTATMIADVIHALRTTRRLKCVELGSHPLQGE